MRSIVERETSGLWCVVKASKVLVEKFEGSAFNKVCKVVTYVRVDRCIKLRKNTQASKKLIPETKDMHPKNPNAPIRTTLKSLDIVVLNSVSISSFSDASKVEWTASCTGSGSSMTIPLSTR